MNCRVTGILIFTAACGIVVSDAFTGLDCRKFVFAPSCRGVASKKDLPVAIDDVFRNAVKSLITTVDNWARDESGLVTRQEELIRDILRERLVHALRMLFVLKRQRSKDNDHRGLLKSTFHDFVSNF